MNFIIFPYCIILLFCYKAGVNAEQSTRASTTTSNLLSNSISTNSNELENISIKDVLRTRSTADTNEKIEQRFTNIINEFSSACKSYKYELNTRNYTFPKKDIRINAGDRIISFDNLTISDWNDDTKGYYIGYSTQLDCDSSTSTIEIALPSNIQIYANVQLTDQSNNSTQKGSVSMVLKNALIKYQFATLRDGINFQERASKISYNTSETRVKIDSKFQPLVYSKLDVFLNEIESSLNEFFFQQLREKMTNSNISLINACSKLTTPKDPIDPSDSPNLNTTLNNLYIISNASQKTWNNVIIYGGPILIQGLSNLNSTKFVIYESHDNDQQYVGGRKYDSIHKKELIVNIETNNVLGKLEWNFNFNQSSAIIPIDYSFFIDNVQFRYSYFVYEYVRDRQVYKSTPAFNDKFTNYINVNVSIGKIQTKILQSNSCESGNFVEIFINKYLKSVLSEQIKNAIVQRISNKPAYSDCVY